MGLKAAAGFLQLPALLFLFGCTTETRSPGETTPEKDASFERIEMEGVTTDHASTGGVSWVDSDGDGDLDLFISNGYDVSAETPTKQPNRFYRNEGDGRFIEVTTGVLAESLGFSSGHTWGDYDNDGDLDLFIANQRDQNNFLFRNEGEGSFVSIEGEPPVQDGGQSYAAAWVDIDSDGWLDLFVANGGMSHVGKNRLYRGIGDGHFEEVSSGAIVEDEAASCGIAWGDYDDDGDPDLYLANQGFSPPGNNNRLYRNDGDGVFTPIEDQPAVTDGLPACGAIWFDLDNDLDLDLYVTNMYGLANRLYRNDGQGRLTPIEEVPIALDAGHSYGVNAADFDNDGDLDLVVANWGAAAVLYSNEGQQRFRRLSAGDFGGRIEHVGAIATGDFDSDGGVDILIGNWPNRPGPDERNSLFRNIGPRGHWLKVRLIGQESNRSGIGARILLTIDGPDGSRTQMREITTQSGFRGQCPLAAHFGLGSGEGGLSLEVRWPSGARSVLSGFSLDQVIVVREADPAIDS